MPSIKHKYSKGPVGGAGGAVGAEGAVERSKADHGHGQEKCRCHAQTNGQQQLLAILATKTTT